MHAQMVKTDADRVKPVAEMDARERAFQERIDAGIKIEPKDWMPEGYRKTLIHQRQGYDALVKLCRKGTRAQKEMAQDALNRWRGDVTALLSDIGLRAP